MPPQARNHYTSLTERGPNNPPAGAEAWRVVSLAMDGALTLVDVLDPSPPSAEHQKSYKNALNCVSDS